MVKTDIPLRLDRLPWSAWHWRVVISLGIIWILDGLEVTIVGSVAAVLGRPDTLQLSDSQIGASASAYLAGAVIGSLLFGRLTDTMGRKKLFLVTLAVYVVATLLTALSWNFASFAFFRALTGMGIGGECSAMNSAVDELIPARVRGRTDLMINGSYWMGTALGAAASLLLLNPAYFSYSIGWRLAFALGAVLGVSIIMVRRHLPESPRWLLLHGRVDEAERTMRSIEKSIEEHTQTTLPPVRATTEVHMMGKVSFSYIIRMLLKRYRKRVILGLTLMTSQAFAYNAIFFTYALILGRFYGVAPERVGYYIIPFAISNFVGPLLLAHLFDTLGRRIMICATYATSGVLLALTGYAFAQGWLTATSQTVLWCAVFFVASAAASSSYLTVSELFAVEMRGMAIALFYSVGTAAGGIVAPALFGALIEGGSRQNVFYGYLVGAALMVFAALIAARYGVAAERKSLEHISELEDLHLAS